MEILGIGGSLRRGSYNRMALEAAQEFTPPDVTLTIHPLSDLPCFNQDLEQDPPESVLSLKEAIRSSDAVLFSTPEYNYSLTGVLKNALDWGSRPYGESAWAGKPAALMGASIGALGTARAQYHLRQILVGLDMPTLSHPEVMIGDAAEKFDKVELIDPVTRGRIGELVEALTTWTRRLQWGAQLQWVGFEGEPAEIFQERVERDEMPD